MRMILKAAVACAALAAIPASAATIANITAGPGTLTFATLAAGDDLRNNSAAFSSSTLQGYIFDEGTSGLNQTFLLHFDRNGGPNTTVAGQFDIQLGAGQAYLGKITTGAGLLASDPMNGVLYQNAVGDDATKYRGLEVDDWVVTVTGSNVNVKYNLVNGTSNAMDEVRFKIGAAVPEPASWALMLGGFGLTGAAMRRRRSQSALTA